jgi:putative oxidoreductase
MAAHPHDDLTALHTHAPESQRIAVPRSSRFRDLGLLILRIGIGAMFVGHGLPKMVGGPTRWAELGEAVANLGVHVGPPAVWGFLAAISELLGGILLATGVLFRPACLFLLSTMCVATITHVSKGDDFDQTSHAAEMAVLFLSLLLIGPGPWRIRIGR